MASLRKIIYFKNVPLKNELVSKRVTCKRCNKPVLDTVVRYQKLCYHVECFVCNTCHRNLRDLKVYCDDNVLLCEKCFLSTLQRCTECGKEIQNEVITLANGAQYHRECFRCAECKSVLDGYFFDYEGQFLCHDHYMSKIMPICKRCNKPIEPENEESQTIVHINYKNEVFHPACFVCDNCNVSFDCNNSTISKSAEELFSKQTPEDKQNMSDICQQFSKLFYPVDGLKLCKKCATEKNKKVKP